MSVIPPAAQATVVFVAIDRLPIGDEASAGVSNDAFENLIEDNIGIVLCSGRNRFELEQLSAARGIWHPFIVEHGSAVCIPGGYFPFAIPGASHQSGFEIVELACPRQMISDRLRETIGPSTVDMTSLCELDDEQLGPLWGMSHREFGLAKRREYSEVLKLNDLRQETLATCLGALRKAELAYAHRGNWIHAGSVLDFRPGIAVLKQLYEKALGDLVTVTIGDSHTATRTAGVTTHTLSCDLLNGSTCPFDLYGGVNGAELAVAVRHVVRECRPPIAHCK